MRLVMPMSISWVCTLLMPGGEYYTPQEVSELLTRLATAGKTEVNKVYDKAVMGLIQEIPQIGAISRLFANDRPMRSYFFALSPVR